MKNYKKDFPIFKSQNIAYLDSAATSQKPQSVIDDMCAFYTSQNANIHRGSYSLSVNASKLYDTARTEVKKFLHAKSETEIVFTKSATESLNLVAQCYGETAINTGDEIVVSILEHHSNILPWQRLAKQKNAKLNYLYVDKNFEISQKELAKITKNTKIVAILNVSNVFGVRVDVERIIKKAHSVGAVVVVDISQSVAHFPFDVQKTDADFVVFSAHKMYGPTGVGVLYGKRELLEKMPPYLLGGDMIDYVGEQEFTPTELPNKFEAGTQNAAGVVGLKSAIEFINKVGFKQIEKVETELLDYAIKKLSALKFLELYLPKRENHIGVISFNIKGVHSHDVAFLLGERGVCVRSGFHCAQPLLHYTGINSTCRISFGIYNTKQDVDRLVDALIEINEKFSKYTREKNG